MAHWLWLPGQGPELLLARRGVGMTPPKKNAGKWGPERPPALPPPLSGMGAPQPARQEPHPRGGTLSPAPRGPGPLRQLAGGRGRCPRLLRPVTRPPARAGAACAGDAPDSRAGGAAGGEGAGPRVGGGAGAGPGPPGTCSFIPAPAGPLPPRHEAAGRCPGPAPVPAGPARPPPAPRPRRPRAPDPHAGRGPRLGVRAGRGARRRDAARTLRYIQVGRGARARGGLEAPAAPTHAHGPPAGLEFDPDPHAVIPTRPGPGLWCPQLGCAFLHLHPGAGSRLEHGPDAQDRALSPLRTPASCTPPLQSPGTSPAPRPQDVSPRAARELTAPWWMPGGCPPCLQWARPTGQSQGSPAGHGSIWVGHLLPYPLALEG